MGPAFGTQMRLRCVALFYALFNNELNDAVSDTTGDATCTIAGKQIILQSSRYAKENSVCIDLCFLQRRS